MTSTSFANFRGKMSRGSAAMYLRGLIRKLKVEITRPSELRLQLQGCIVADLAEVFISLLIPLFWSLVQYAVRKRCWTFRVLEPACCISYLAALASSPF